MIFNSEISALYFLRKNILLKMKSGISLLLCAGCTFQNVKYLSITNPETKTEETRTVSGIRGSETALKRSGVTVNIESNSVSSGKTLRVTLSSDGAHSAIVNADCLFVEKNTGCVKSDVNYYYSLFRDDQEWKLKTHSQNGTSYTKVESRKAPSVDLNFKYVSIDSWKKGTPIYIFLVTVDVPPNTKYLNLKTTPIKIDGVDVDFPEIKLNTIETVTSTPIIY